MHVLDNLIEQEGTMCHWINKEGHGNFMKLVSLCEMQKKKDLPVRDQ